jgi:hypothetical protein
MMKAQLMAGMALSIVLAGSLTPMARALDSVPTPTASTVQEKGNHLADKAQPDKMEAKAVQLISEETHQPIANESIVVDVHMELAKEPELSHCVVAPCNVHTTSIRLRRWEGKTDASGVILIPRNMISGRDAGHLDILAKRSFGGDLGIAVDKAFLNEPGVFKATLFDPDTRWRNKVTNRAVQIISEVTHKPIVNQSIFVSTWTICENLYSYCPDRSLWEGKTDASGIIVIPRDVILSGNGKTLDIATFRGTICKDAKFCPDNDLWGRIQGMREYSFQ